jgi:hypothetical protein
MTKICFGDTGYLSSTLFAPKLGGVGSIADAIGAFPHGRGRVTNTLLMAVS